MTTQAPVKLVLADLVVMHRQGQKPRLRPEDRQLVIDLLERILPAPDGVLYMEGLLRPIMGEFPNCELPERCKSAVLDGNWSEVDDTTLGCLVLNPPVMWELDTAILHTLPGYWRKVMDRQFEQGWDDIELRELRPGGRRAPVVGPFAVAPQEPPPLVG